MPLIRVTSIIKSFFYRILNIGSEQAKDKRELRRIRILNAALMCSVPFNLFIFLGIFLEHDHVDRMRFFMVILPFVLFWINTFRYKISLALFLSILIVQRIVACYFHPGLLGEYSFLIYSVLAIGLYPPRQASIFFLINFLAMLVGLYLDQPYPPGALILLFIFYITGAACFFVYTKEMESYARELLVKNQKIEEQAQQLQEADELKTRFFINVSHEFRTPVTIVQGIIENIRSGIYGPTSQTIREKLKKADNSTSRLLQLVNNMLDLTKLEKGAMQLNEKPVSLHELLNRQADIFRTMAHNRNIEIDVQHESSSKSFLLDEEKFESIISNLLSNALKFTPAGGKIFIETDCGENCFTIKIRDTGIGIAAADLPHIFDRFYQAKVKKIQGGAGVGLALVKELITLHEGSVSVVSTEEKGTTFTLSLPASRIIEDNIFPRSPDVLPEISSDEQVTKTKDHSGKSILIVEDNDEMGEYLQDLLLNERYKTDWASGGRAGLEKLKESLYDLIITDYMMPDMDGKEFTEQVKSMDKFKNIPLIFLTARNEKEGKLEVLRLGVDDYILKPFYQEELLLKISNLLQNAESRKKFLVKTGLEADLSEEERFLLEVRALVDRNMSNSLYKLTDLAEDLNITERQLFRKVKAFTGMTPNNLIKEIKLQYARQLFEQKSFSTIKEVASGIGYENSAHFVKIFEEKFGRHPATFFAES